MELVEVMLRLEMLNERR